MTEPFRILTVCLGNVCRSPLAERLLRARLDPAAYDVSSAGLIGMAGRPMERNAADELRRLGGDPDGFVARRLTPEILRGVDLVLTATVEVRQELLEEAPHLLKRAFTLRELAALVEGLEAGSPQELVAEAARTRGRLSGVDLDVVDPMGRGAELHRQAADAIDHAVTPIAAALMRAAERARDTR